MIRPPDIFGLPHMPELPPTPPMFHHYIPVLPRHVHARIEVSFYLVNIYVLPVVKKPFATVNIINSNIINTINVNYSFYYNILITSII